MSDKTRAKSPKSKRTKGKLGKALSVGALLTAAGELLARKPAEAPSAQPERDAALAPEAAALVQRPADAVEAAVDAAPGNVLPPALHEAPVVSAELAELLAQLADADAAAAAASGTEDSVLMAQAAVDAPAAETPVAAEPVAGASAGAAEGAAAAATLSGTTAAILGGVGAVGLGLAAGGSSSPAPMPTPTPTPTPEPTAAPLEVSGRVVDGYVKDARVFYDANENGVRDSIDANNNGRWDEGEGEAWTWSDAQGNFKLTGYTKTEQGRIVVEAGGTDIETGETIGTLMAPMSADGTVLVSPLTLILALNPGLSQDSLKEMLGIDPDVDLLSFDPVAAMDAGGDGADLGEQVFAAQQQLYALIQAATTVAAGDGAVDFAALSTAITSIGEAIESAGDDTDLGAIAQTAFTALVDGDGPGAEARIELLTAAVKSSMEAIEEAYVTTGDEMSLSEARRLWDAGNTGAEGYAEALARLAEVKAAASVSQVGLLDLIEKVESGEIANLETLQQDIAEQVKAQEDKYSEQLVKDNSAPSGGVGIAIGGLPVDGAPQQGQTLTATSTLADADGLGSLQYQWQADGKDIAGATASTLTLGQAQVGKAITVEVRYADGGGKIERAESTATAAVANVNDTPTGTAGAALAAGTEDVAYTVKAADLLKGFADVDGDTLSVAGLSASHGTVKDNGDGTWTITPAAHYNGPVKLSYDVVDGNGGKVTASQGFTLAAVDDKASGELVVTGTAQEGGTLKAELKNVVDADGAAATAYQWQRQMGTIDAPNWQDIAGATGAELVLPADQSAMAMRVRVVATTTDDLGGKTIFRSAGQNVVNVDDEATGTLGVTGSAVEGGLLKAEFSGLADEDGGVAGVAYQWQVQTAEGWADIDGAKAAEFAVAGDQSLVGKDVRVVATTTDALKGQTVFEGAAQRIGNVDDEATGTLAVTGTSQFNQVLTAELAGLADADGGATVTAYQWQRQVGTSDDGRPVWAPIEGATGATYTPGVGATGRNLRVEVTTTDALGGTTTFTSEPQFVAATSTVTISDGTVTSLLEQGGLNGMVDRLQAAGMQTLAMNGAQAMGLAGSDKFAFSLEAGLDVVINGGGTFANADDVMAAKLHTLLADADVTLGLNGEDMKAVLASTDDQLDAAIDQLQAVGMDQLLLNPFQVAQLAKDDTHLGFDPGTNVVFDSTTVAGTSFLSLGASTGELGSLLGAADVTVRLTDADLGKVLLAQGGSADDALDALVDKLHAAGMDTLRLTTGQVDQLATANLDFDAGTDLRISSTFGNFVAGSEQQYAALLADADVSLRLAESDLPALGAGTDPAMDQVINRLQDLGMDRLELDAGQVAKLADAGLSFDPGTDVTVTGTSFLSAGGVTAGELGTLLGDADVTVRLSEQDFAQVLHAGDASLDALVQQLQSAGMDALELDFGQLDALAAADFSLASGTEVTLRSLEGTDGDIKASDQQFATLLQAADATFRFGEQDMAGIRTNDDLDEWVDDLHAVGMDQLELDAGQVAALAGAGMSLAAGTDVTVVGTSFLSADGVELADLNSLLGGADVTVQLSEQDLHEVLSASYGADAALDSLTSRLDAAGVDALELDAGQALELAAQGGLTFNGKVEIDLADPLTLAAHAGAAQLESLKTLLAGADTSAELTLADLRATQPKDLAALRGEVTGMQGDLAAAGVDAIEFSDELAQALAEADVQFSAAQGIVVRAGVDTPGNGDAFVQASLQDLQRLGVDRVEADAGASTVLVALHDQGSAPAFDLNDLPRFDAPAGAEVGLIVTEADLAALLSSFDEITAAGFTDVFVTDGNGTSADFLAAQAASGGMVSWADEPLSPTEVQLLGLGSETSNPLDPFHKQQG